MVNNMTSAALAFLKFMLSLLAITVFSPIVLPILSYYQLRTKEYSRTVSVVVALAVFTVVSSVYFLAVIVPFFMPTLAIAASIIELSQTLLILCPRLIETLIVILEHFFPPPSFYFNNNRLFRSSEPVYSRWREIICIKKLLHLDIESTAWH